MERDDVCNDTKVGRPPDYLVSPGIRKTAILQRTRRSISHLGAAIEVAVVKFREPTIWLMQLK